jgi:hypothetical protein
MLNKGKRQMKLARRKETAHVMDHFNKTLENMNLVMSKLMNDSSLTKENFKDKVSAITDFKFSEKQYNMLTRELFKDESAEKENFVE